MVSIQPHSQALQIHVLAAYFTIELSKDIGQVCSQESRVGNGLSTSLVCLKVDHDQSQLQYFNCGHIGTLSATSKLRLMCHNSELRIFLKPHPLHAHEGVVKMCWVTTGNLNRTNESIVAIGQCTKCETALATQLATSNTLPPGSHRCSCTIGKLALWLLI